jgi:hypothetical protein
MTVIETLGILLGLAVMALMALAPTLVTLNDRFPPEHREKAPAARTPSARTTLLGHHIPAHR